MRPMPCLALLLVVGAVLVPGGSVADDRAEERTAVIGLLGPRRGETIADVGCGHGTWTFELARAVGPTGRVLAVDIDPDAISSIRAQAERDGIENVEVIHSAPDDPMLPPDSLDAIFLNAMIDWVERQALAGFLAGLWKALRADGRLVIRDPSGGPARVISELYRNGFSLVEAKIPLSDSPSRSFGTGWYALKVRKSEIQPPILPRLGRPSRYRLRLHLAEELFRSGLLERQELKAKWQLLRDRPGPFDPAADEARDLVAAARTLDVLTEAEAQALRERIVGKTR